MKSIDDQIIYSLLNDLPGFICYFRQNFCASEFSQLTLQQSRLLSLLLDENLTPSEVAEKLGVSLPAISRMIKPFIENKWIIKATNNQDQRSAQLKLTAVGKKKLISSQSAFKENLKSPIQDLSEGDKKALIKAFEIMKSMQK